MLQSLFINRHQPSCSELPDIPEEKLVTSPARIQGYSLVNKTWGYVLVDDIDEIEWEDD